MAYLAEIPNEAELGRFYGTYSNHRAYEARRLTGWRVHLGATRNVRVRMLEQSGTLRGCRVLELGAAHGDFLAHVRARGAASCFAVEPDERSRAQLTALGIANGAAFLDEARFDVACAFDVLEHLAAPSEMIANIARVLEPDGRAFFSVPNGGEIDQVGEHWVGFRADLEHLNYFSLETLSSLCARAGLLTEHFWFHAQPGLFRRDQPSNDGYFARMIRLLDRFTEAGRIARTGTYVVSILVRKPL